MIKTHILTYVEELDREVQVLINISDVVREFGEEIILEELNYDIEYCFSGFGDLENYIKANLYDFDIPLAEEYQSFQQQNIHDRMVRFIDSHYYDSVSYEELDNYLTQKGF